VNKTKLQEDCKIALKKSNKTEVSTLRLLLAAIQSQEIEKRGEELTEKDLITLLQKEAKKRKEAIELYEKAGKGERAEAEAEELKIIEQYLPKALSEEETVRIVEAAIESVKPEGPQDFGTVMGAAMKAAEGRADSGAIKKAIEARIK